MNILEALTYVAAALATVNVTFQGIDLHSTVEILKRNLGREVNPELQFMNDTSLTIGERFSRLLTIKVRTAALMAATALGAWLVPETAPFAILANAYVIHHYFPVLKENLRILRDKGAH